MLYIRIDLHEKLNSQYNYRNPFVTQYLTYLNIWGGLSMPLSLKVSGVLRYKLIPIIIEHHCYIPPKSYYHNTKFSLIEID